MGDLEPGRRRGGHRRQMGRRSRQNRGKGGGTGVSLWKGPTVHESQPQGPSKRSQAPRLSGGKDLRRADRRGACASSLDEFGARSAHVQMNLPTGQDVRPRTTRAINGQAHWSIDCAPPGPTTQLVCQGGRPRGGGARPGWDGGGVATDTRAQRPSSTPRRPPARREPQPPARACVDTRGNSEQGQVRVGKMTVAANMQVGGGVGGVGVAPDGVARVWVRGRACETGGGHVPGGGLRI